MDVIQAVAEKAVTLVDKGQTIGLGSGRAAEAFVRALAKKIQKEKLDIKAVASSLQTEKLAKEQGIEVIDDKKIEALDMYFDGADEIDKEKNMIKGKGGALLREKILSNIACQTIILVDDTKLVAYLGSKVRLAVEITPFALLATKKRLQEEGYIGDFRRNKEKEGFYITDNKNFIIDVIKANNEPFSIQDQNTLLQIPGVLETGLFFDYADRIIVGYENQRVEILE